MSTPGALTPFYRAFYSLGYAVGELERVVSGKPGAAFDQDHDDAGAAAFDSGPGTWRLPGGAVMHPEGVIGRPEDVPEEADDPADELEDDDEAAVIPALRMLLGFVLPYLVRPRAIRWPRAILAGVAAALASEAVAGLERGGPADGNGRGDVAARALRYAGGVGTAAFYAAMILPRLPGSPLARALALGAAEAATAQLGGTAVLLSRASPELAGPLQALATPPGEGPGAAFAFGFVAGLIYGEGPGPLAAS